VLVSARNWHALFSLLGRGVDTAAPLQGCVHTKMEQVPHRTYSLSSQAFRPGRAGSVADLAQ